MHAKTKLYVVISCLCCVLLIVLCLLIYSFKSQVLDINRALSDIAVVEFNRNMPTTKYHNYEQQATILDSIENYATSDYFAFQEEYSTYINETSMSYSVSEPNAYLYSLCDQYFIVSYSNTRMSPLVPLAMANVETPGRADHSITWSSLFPSAILPISYLENMDVTTVVSDSNVYKALSTESSTRDRGALQMSPTYGTGNAEFNRLMSGTEKDKLSYVEASQYSAWVSGASTHPGDRFYTPDVLLRLSSAFTSAIEDMVKHNYIPKSDAQLMVMCSMYHHRSGVWTGKANGGNTWKSSQLAYEYSEKISSQEFVNVLRSYSYDHPDTWCISGDVAMQLYKSVYGDPYTYCDKKLVLSYPIKFLYAYVRMSQMYGG